MNLTNMDIILAKFLIFTLVFSNIKCTRSPVDSKCASNKGCKCTRISENQVSADCSKLNLTTWPEFFRNVTRVNLSDNKLHEIPALWSGLQRLDLSSNQISGFNETSFIEAKNLLHLNLENNGLNFSAYFPGLFQPLFHLRYLNLKKNINTNGITPYPDEAFKSLLSLEILKIDGIQNPVFGTGFSYLKNLSVLDLSGSTGNCNLSRVTLETFKSLTNLQKIDLSSCHILQIDVGALSWLSYLRDLDISFNEYLTFSGLKNVSVDLPNTSITVLKANKLYCTFGFGTVLRSDVIQPLEKTNLTILHLERNRIELVEPDAISFCPKSLEHVSVAENKFTMGQYLLELYKISNLRSVNISGLFFTFIENFSLCENTQSSNTCPNIKEHISYIQKISLRGNIWETYRFPENLTHIDANRITCRYALPAILFPKNNVMYLNLSGNTFFKWVGPMFNIEKLAVLDLSDNFCSNVSQYFFAFMTGLHTLLLSNNMLGYSLETDTQGNTFKTLTRLHKLDLSSNKIQELPYSIFRNLHHLQKLHLNDNPIRNLSVSFRQMSRLEFIDLSNNQLYVVSPDVMEDLDSIARTNNLTVDFTGNPFLCNCNTLKFLDWINGHERINFKNFAYYTCKTKSNEVINFTRLHYIILELQKECTSYIGLIICVSLVIIVILVVIVCGILYRYRWKLRYLYYMAKQRYRGYLSMRSDANVGNFTYDAFVSYADEDRSFAFIDMKKSLEDVHGLQICLHHRDFIPGKDIAENILYAMHHSRKIIFVLSPNFIKSYWCMYELNMAWMENIYSRKEENIILLVVMETVPPEDMSVLLLHLIQSQSYIEYPNDPHYNDDFWTRMKDSIVNDG